MSLKFITTLILFILLIVYFTFLNPSDIQVYFTQNHPLTIPTVVFLLGSILIGVTLTAVFSGFQQMKSSLRAYRKLRAARKKEKQHQKCQSLYRKAFNEIQSGRRGKGIVLLEKIIAIDAAHTEALDALGNQLREAGTVDRAIEMHKKALNLDPDHLSARFNLALDHAAAGMTQQEVYVLKEMLQLSPNSLPALRRLRDAHVKLKQFEPAYQMQASILPLTHDSKELAHERVVFSQITFQYGMELYGEKKYESAAFEFKRALRENSQCLPAHMMLGDLYQKTDQMKAAVKTWKKGFQATQSPLLILRLQQAYEQMNLPKEIKKLYHSALSTSQNANRETLAMLYAGLLLEQGQTEEATQVLEKLESPSVTTQMFALQTLLQQKNLPRAEAISKSAFHQLTQSMGRFVCSSCHTGQESWSGFCPQCGGWDTLQLKLAHHL